MNLVDAYANRKQSCHLNVYDLESRSVEELCGFDKVVEAPMWSGDGRTIYFNSYGLIYAFDLETREVREVDTGIMRACNNDHVLTPDGKGMVVSGNVDGTVVSKIYYVDLETREVREIVGTPWSYLHGITPDGKTYAYCAGRKYDDVMQWDVYTCCSDGSNETRLTDAPGLNDGCEYSSDGKTIWFNSVRTGLMQVWKMNSDGSEQTQMTFDEDRNSWFPHISPDLTKVVYLAYHKDDLDPGKHIPDLHVEIRMIPANGGKPETLVKLFGGQGTINVNSWSPDSKKFAFVSYDE